MDISFGDAIGASPSNRNPLRGIGGGR